MNRWRYGFAEVALGAYMLFFVAYLGFWLFRFFFMKG